MSTIINRAQRFQRDPSETYRTNVGPGSYDWLPVSEAFRTGAVKQNTLGGTANRGLLTQVIDLEKPDPGSYQSIPEVSAEQLKHSSFKSKTKRFTEIFKNDPEIPGPGTYNLKQMFHKPCLSPKPLTKFEVYLKNQMRAKLEEERQPAKIKQQKKIPSIPYKDRSAGYDETSEGVLTPNKACCNTDSGEIGRAARFSEALEPVQWLTPRSDRSKIPQTLHQIHHANLTRCKQSRTSSDCKSERSESFGSVNLGGLVTVRGDDSDQVKRRQNTSLVRRYPNDKLNRGCAWSKSSTARCGWKPCNDLSSPHYYGVRRCAETGKGKCETPRTLYSKLRRRAEKIQRVELSGRPNTPLVVPKILISTQQANKKEIEEPTMESEEGPIIQGQYIIDDWTSSRKFSYQSPPPMAECERVIRRLQPPKVKATKKQSKQSANEPSKEELRNYSSLKLCGKHLSEDPDQCNVPYLKQKFNGNLEDPTVLINSKKLPVTGSNYCKPINKHQPDNEPGPGTYDVPSGFSSLEQVKVKQILKGVSKTVPFGSSDSRLKQQSKDKQLFPGPGDYEISRTPAILERNKHPFQPRNKRTLGGTAPRFDRSMKDMPETKEDDFLWLEDLEPMESEMDIPNQDYNQNSIADRYKGGATSAFRSATLRTYLDMQRNKEETEMMHREMKLKQLRESRNTLHLNKSEDEMSQPEQRIATKKRRNQKKKGRHQIERDERRKRVLQAKKNQERETPGPGEYNVGGYDHLGSEPKTGHSLPWVRPPSPTSTANVFFGSSRHRFQMNRWKMSLPGPGEYWDNRRNLRSMIKPSFNNSICSNT